MAGPAGRTTRTAGLSRLGPPTSVALAVVALDLITKSAVVASLQEGQRAPVLALGGAVTMTLSRSPAFAFSAAAVVTGLVLVLAAAVMAGIARRDRRVRSPGWGVASGLVLGGVLGNLVDRLVRAPAPGGRYVVDFFSVGGSPAFNVADVSIVLGALSMLLLAAVGSRSDENGQVEDPAPTTELDQDDEKVALLDRPKYPSLKWDPMPGKSRYLAPRQLDDDSSAARGADSRAAGEQVTADPDDLVDEDDRLPGRTRHPANKWDRG